MCSSWNDAHEWVTCWEIPTLAGGLQLLRTVNGGWLSGRVVQGRQAKQSKCALCEFVSTLPACQCGHGLKSSLSVSMSPMREELLERRSQCIIPNLTGSTCGPQAWPEWREPGFLRMDHSGVCSNQRGRGMTKTSSAPPPRTCPPQPCSFPCSDACFQEGQASCVMGWWKRWGRGGGGTQRKRQTPGERWIMMAWWSSARSD